MTNVADLLDSTRPAEDIIHTRRFSLLVSEARGSLASHPDEADGDVRIFKLDAGFETGGAWAGVEQLIESAYLELLEMRQDAIVEEHIYELHRALPKYRSTIVPRYLCLTDTASPAERTRVYAVDRGYRLVHGLVGMVLRWRRALTDQGRWIVIARNFDQAQYLTKRFFLELARRGTSEFPIDVIIETQRDWTVAALDMQGILMIPAPRLGVEIKTDWSVRHEFDEAEIGTIQREADCHEAVLEQKHTVLIAHYRRASDGLAAARVALKMLVLYNRNAYYHEARHFIDAILPYFDQIVGNDERERMKYVGEMYSTLVWTDDSATGLRLVQELAVPYLTKPEMLANAHYNIGVHHLRYADSKNLEVSEQHFSQAVEYIRAAEGNPDLGDYPFRKSFIDNGLALLRVRQGRHQDAIDLCQSAYRSLTSQLGEDQHLLHRSVLHYNTGQALVIAGRLEEGLEYYDKAIGMDPYYPDYYNEKGNFLQELGHYDNAIDNYCRAIKYSAPFPEVYFNKALCHARQEQWQDALTCFATSLELNPNQPLAHALRAETYNGLGRVDEALADYDRAIALGDDSVAMRVNRAVLHFNQGSYELALADMDRVIALEPDNTAHYENRAAIYEALNRHDLYLADVSASERGRKAA